MATVVQGAAVVHGALEPAATAGRARGAGPWDMRGWSRQRELLELGAHLTALEPAGWLQHDAQTPEPSASPFANLGAPEV